MNARPPVWIGPRGTAALAALGVIGGLFALVVPWPDVAIGVALVMTAALVGDAGLLARPLQIVRTVPEHLALARPDVFTYTLTNRCAVAVRFAVFEAPVAKLAVAVAPARVWVAAHADGCARIAFTPLERGRTTVGVAFGWYESPLGLVRRRVRVGVATPIRIRPGTMLDRNGDVALRTRLIDAGLRRVRRRGAGTEFESLRDYTAGDPFRAIDWKASARRGHTMVTQYEVERSQQIVIALDAGRLMSARLGDRRKLDYAVSAALGVAAVAQRAADRVGLHAFAATTLAAVGPRAGATQTAALTDALTDLEPHFEEADYERAALELRRRCRKRTLIVLFTDLFDPVASGAVLAALALLVPQHLVLVVLMNDAALDAAREQTVDRASAGYRASIATKLAAERTRAVALLRDRGIGVIDVPAGDLTLAVIDAYVDIKSRGAL